MRVQPRERAIGAAVAVCGAAAYPRARARGCGSGRGRRGRSARETAFVFCIRSVETAF